MVNSQFSIRFYGVRGSYPVSRGNFLKYGGNTTCAYLTINGHKIIIDGGTGVINLGMELLDQQPVIATLLFTHMHHDHNQGFPFFKPAYLPTSKLYMFGPAMFQKNLEDILSLAMLPPFFPVELSELKSFRDIKNLQDSDIIVLKEGEDQPELYNVRMDVEELKDKDVKISILKSYAHPKTGVLIYKFEANNKKLVFATDTEGYIGGDRRLVEFSQGADILVHDAQYTTRQYEALPAPKQGFGHSTPEMAIDLAKRAGVKQLILTHFDPENDDELIERLERGSRKYFANTVAAYEGLEINLTADLAD